MIASFVSVFMFGFLSTDQEESSYSLGLLGDSSSQIEVTKRTASEFCLELPCLTMPTAHRVMFLSAYGPTLANNICKRYKDYKEYYRVLKKERLLEK